jgi:hypothetical protein
VRLDELVSELDAYFGVPEVRGDDWSGTFEFLYPDPYWREFAEPGYRVVSHASRGRRVQTGGAGVSRYAYFSPNGSNPSRR